MWLRIQHARPLVQLWVSEIWLSYTPAGTGSGVEIHFEFFFSITLGEDPARWSPCSLHNDLNFGLLIPLPVPAVGLRFILNFFFPSLWVRIQHAGPLVHFTMTWILACLYPCRYRQWGWDSFWNIFFHHWVRIQHAGPLAHFTMSWVLACLYPCRYRQWVWDRFMLCKSLVMQKPPNLFMFMKFIDSLEIHILIIHDSCQLEFWRK
jgi:hypothetical protein